MDAFLDRNPGLRSRIPFRIDFPDYSPEEMEKIAELEAAKHGFTISGDAKDVVVDIAEKVVGNAAVGNGRFSRNLVQSAILSYAAREYGEGNQKSRSRDGDRIQKAVGDADAAETNDKVLGTNSIPDPDGAKDMMLMPEDFAEYSIPEKTSEKHVIGFRL